MPGPGRGPRPPWPVAGESICATCPAAVSCRVSTTSKPNLRLPTTHNQPTNRPPASSSAYSRPLTVLSAKWQVLNLLQNLSFHVSQMRQTFKYFQLGVETAMETIISFPGRVFCILRLQYLQNERDTDSLILGPKDSLEINLFWNNCRESQHFWHTRWSSNNPLKVCRLKSNNRFQIDLCRRWCAAQNMENI